MMKKTVNILLLFSLIWAFSPAVANGAVTGYGTMPQWFYWQRSSAGVLSPGTAGDTVNAVISYSGSNRPTSYIYPLTLRHFTKDWAGAADHDLDIMAESADPTTATLTNQFISVTSNAADDYDYLVFIFYLPDNFDGFLTAALSIDTYSTDYANTDLEITLSVNGTNDATIAALDINPTADTSWQTKTSAVGTAWSSTNKNQECRLMVKFLGDAADELRIRNLKLAYYRSN